MRFGLPFVHLKLHAGISYRFSVDSQKQFSEDNDVIVSYKPLFQASRLKFKINMADEHKDMFLMFN